MKDRKDSFRELRHRVKTIVGTPPDGHEKLTSICEALRHGIAHYDWVEFYIADWKRNELLIGPEAGEPTEHVRIAFGSGVCGQSVESRETLIVQDVSKETNCLFCSPKAGLDIVVPIVKGGQLVAEPDVGRPILGPFAGEDQRDPEGTLVGVMHVQAVLWMDGAT